MYDKSQSIITLSKNTFSLRNKGSYFTIQATEKRSTAMYFQKYVPV